MKIWIVVLSLMKRPYQEKIYFKKQTDHSSKAYKNKKAIAVGFIKKKGKMFSVP